MCKWRAFWSRRIREWRLFILLGLLLFGSLLLRSLLLCSSLLLRSLLLCSSLLLCRSQLLRILLLNCLDFFCGRFRCRCCRGSLCKNGCREKENQNRWPTMRNVSSYYLLKKFSFNFTGCPQWTTSSQLSRCRACRCLLGIGRLFCLRSRFFNRRHLGHPKGHTLPFFLDVSHVDLVTYFHFLRFLQNEFHNLRSPVLAFHVSFNLQIGFPIPPSPYPWLSTLFPSNRLPLPLQPSRPQALVSWSDDF